MTNIRLERLRYMLRYRGKYIRREGNVTMFYQVSAKCPCCQQYSLTYDFLRDQYRCHVYGGIITAEQLSRVTQS